MVIKQLCPEEALVKVLARVSLRNIARFRSVCKEWKCLIDSDFFRDLYESLKSSSTSVSWSIMNTRDKRVSLEIVGHHGCERWGLTNSLGSYMHHIPETTVRKSSVLSCTDGIVLLYTETVEGELMYHVGNPLLRQWARIPLPSHLSAFDVVRLQENRHFSDNGLVTKMEKGVVVGYKVVWVLASTPLSRELTFMIYSSQTGLWKNKRARCVRSLFWSRLGYYVPLNGVLHWLAAYGCSYDANYVASYDFYNGCDDDLDYFNIIPFPGIERFERNQRFKRTITTSAGFVVYCNVFNDNGGRTIRVWRLVSTNDHPKSWKLSWKLNTNSSLHRFGADYFPVVMHPLNSDIIYLWSRNKNGLVLLNLRTHKFSLHKEEASSEDDEEGNTSMDGCIMSFSGCKEYMDLIHPIFFNNLLGGFHNLYFSQYVLPRWLNPLPQLSS
ncbi:PREDICTED: putative F-box protein At3g23950 [Camelina sativa]|uniref:F-box protein At3g23950 n=1 Tax=Camelina sativa TaxID=90675 RepID=A0ABM0TD62_CAMSA|nr:PREDICTED: putative F-box protein At3g23950 [Camelina sativa]